MSVQHTLTSRERIVMDAIARYDTGEGVYPLNIATYARAKGQHFVFGSLTAILETLCQEGLVTMHRREKQHRFPWKGRGLGAKPVYSLTEAGKLARYE